jgi:hypothetical protein
MTRLAATYQQPATAAEIAQGLVHAGIAQGLLFNDRVAATVAQARLP